MLKQFFKYITQSVAGMIGISVYILADTFFISVQSGADEKTVVPQHTAGNIDQVSGDFI